MTPAKKQPKKKQPAKGNKAEAKRRHPGVAARQVARRGGPA